ncbi:syntaxin-12 [Centruroides vittatus]|uniref:syntaxin-12 n=1 Tax=Centruroides vittatus TaxID=120091 RepID=UPI00350FED45
MSYSNTGNFPNYGATEDGQFSSPSRNSLPIYHQLCDLISSNIFAINNGASALEQSLKQLGTAADSSLLRDKIHNTQQTCNDIIANTTKSLRTLTSIITSSNLPQRESRQQRLQLERLKNEFQEIVKRYSSLQGQIADKIKRELTIKPRKSISGWSIEDEGKYDEQQSLMEAEKIQQQKKMEADLEFEQQLLAEREQRIQQIEADMLDINSVFRDLAALVHEQGATIDTIESNVEAVAENTARGTEHLSKASRYQRGYRKKLCLLLLILAVVILVIVLIVILSKN